MPPSLYVQGLSVTPTVRNLSLLYATATDMTLRTPQRIVSGRIVALRLESGCVPPLLQLLDVLTPDGDVVRDVFCRCIPETMGTCVA